MSKGKYSPSLTCQQTSRSYRDYCYNADKQIPPVWTLEMKERDEIYNTRLYFADYDADGYDSYGYSAFDADGNYVGIGGGIDRWGYTEDDYLWMSDEQFIDVCKWNG